MDLTTAIMDDNNLIVKIGNKKALLSLGTNFSLSNDKTVTILGKTFNLTDQYMGFSLKDVNKYLNVDIDYILGSEILSKYNLKIDYKNKELKLSDTAINDLKESIPIKYELEIPKIPFKVNNRNVEAILDTISNLSYVNEKNLDEKSAKGEETDFFLGMGNFETKYYNSTYTLGEESFNLKTALYPSVISKSRFLTVDKIVIGKELLKNFVLLINSFEKQIYYEKI